MGEGRCEPVRSLAFGEAALGVLAWPGQRGAAPPTGRARATKAKGHNGPVIAFPFGKRVAGPDRGAGPTACLWAFRGRRANELLVMLPPCAALSGGRSEEHTSELQSLMRLSYAVFCLKKK